MPTHRLEEIYAPVARDLSETLGIVVALKTRPTFEAYTSALGQEAFEFALVQPFDYVKAADRYDYLPLARTREDLTAVFVVREDSTLASLDDLKFLQIGMPPATAAVSRLAMAAVATAMTVGPNAVRRRHFKEHESCLQAMVSMIVPVCATARAQVGLFERRTGLTLRVLAETESIPHLTFVAHRRVPQPHRIAVTNRILSWRDDKLGAAILDRSGFPAGFMAASDGDYDAVRQFPGSEDSR